MKVERQRFRGAFDSPFVRGWVLLEALPDVGWEAEFPWRPD